MPGVPTVRAPLGAVRVPSAQRVSETLSPRATLELVHAPGGSTESTVSAYSSEKAKEVAYEDSFPDGGKGWVVVFGCFIYSAATVGWGCVTSPLPSLRY